MKNYRESDYAINKYNVGIAYRFADGTSVTVTLEDYNAQNYGEAVPDFNTLKAESDRIYEDQVTAENAQTKKNIPFDEAIEISFASVPSPEEMLIAKIDAREEAKARRLRLQTAKRALDTLTDIQRRRYLLYHVKGLNLRQIAEKERVLHSKIQKSIDAAEKTIRKFLANS